jgi:hypothetical protein
VTADPKTIPSIPASENDRPGAPRDGRFGPITARASANNKTAGRWGIWLWRTRSALFVTLCATFGVLLLILPWTPRWTDNPLLLASPALREVVASGFARGLASGLGLLDLWLGFWEAIHYHETPHGSGQ